MKILIILITIFTFQTTIGQAKKKSSGNKAEIDILYSKYKDSDEITLYTPFGELSGNVSCNLNSDNKAENIEIRIETENRDGVAKFIADLIQQKLKNGYKQNNATYDTSWEFESIKYMLDLPDTFESMREPFYFTKKNMFTKIEYSCSNCESYNNGSKVYIVSVMTGDKSRAGGKKATKFEF